MKIFSNFNALIFTLILVIKAPTSESNLLNLWFQLFRSSSCGKNRDFSRVSFIKVWLLKLSLQYHRREAFIMRKSGKL